MSKKKGQAQFVISGIQAVKSRAAIENFKKDGIRPYEILRILLAVIFTYFPISVSVSALRMTYPIYYLIFPTFVIVGVYFLVGKIKKGFYKFVVQIAIMGLYALRNYEDILAGVKSVAERFVNIVTNDEATLSKLYTSSNTKSVEITLITTVYIIVFIVLFLSTIDIFNLAIHILFTVPFYILPYIMGIKYEPYIPVVIMVHGILMFVMFFADEKMLEINQEPNNAYNVKGTRAISVRVVIWAAVVTTIVALALVFAEPENEYKEDSIYEYVEQKIIQIANDIKNLTAYKNNGGNNEGNKGLGGGYLGQIDKVERSDDQKVKVILDKVATGNMYIRLNTYGKYLWEKKDGRILNKWLDTNGFSDQCGLDVIESINRTANKALDEMFLQGVEKYDYDIYYNCDDLETGLPVPYFSKHNMIAARDYVVLPGNLGREYLIECSGYYLAADETSLSSYQKISNYVKKYKIHEKEREQYEQYIAEEYLQVPAQLDIFHKAFGDKEFNNLEECIIYVKDYLSDYEYTLEPGKCEQGDFVEDFLFNRKKGYCEYFATAATLMLREFGYPARYVEGYMISPGNYEKIGKSYKYIATGKDAHAWCEVYIEGVGWVPIEVTVGRGFDEEDTDNHGTLDVTTPEEPITEDVTSEEWTTQEETTIEITTTEDPKTTYGEEISSGGEETTTGLGETEEETKEQTTTEDENADEKWGWDIDDETFRILNYIFVGLIIFLLLLARVIKYHQKKKRFDNMLTSSDYKDRANAVREIFNDFIKMEKIELPYYEMRNKHCERITEKYPDLSRKAIMKILKVVDMSVYADSIKDEKSVDVAIAKLKDVILKVYGGKNIVYKCILRYIKCLYLFQK